MFLKQSLELFHHVLYIYRRTACVLDLGSSPWCSLCPKVLALLSFFCHSWSAQVGYPHYLILVIIFSFSTIFLPSSVMWISIQWKNVLSTLSLWATGWCESHCRKWSVWGFPIYISTDLLTLVSPLHIQHGQISFTVLFFHIESNALMLASDVFEQTLYIVFLLHSACVINVPPPEVQKSGGSDQSLDLEHLHKHVGNDHWDWWPHGHGYLFYFNTLHITYILNSHLLSSLVSG